MVGRAGGGADLGGLGDDKVEQLVGIQHCGRLLEEKALVGTAAALGDEEEFVGVVALGVDLDLGRQIGAGVAFVEHRQRRQLRVPQIQRGVCARNAPGQMLGVMAVGEHLAAAAGMDDGRPGVLAHRQHPAGGDVRIAQQLGGHVAIVGRRLRVRRMAAIWRRWLVRNRCDTSRKASNASCSNAL